MATKKTPGLTTAELKQKAKDMLDRRRAACVCAEPLPVPILEGAFVVTVCGRCQCYTKPAS